MDKELEMYRAEMLDRFSRVVEDISQAYQAVPEHLRRQPVNGESPHRTIVHLRDIEKYALAPRLCSILEEEKPLLALFDDEAWLEANYSPEEDSQAILEEYASIHQQEMDRIASLPDGGWNRLSRHPWFGVRTYQWWVEKTLAYAEEHLDRLRQVQESVS